MNYALGTDVCEEDFYKSIELEGKGIKLLGNTVMLPCFFIDCVLLVRVGTPCL
jgi:hypothetical protein